MNNIPEINPDDLRYYSDMDAYEFTAANRAWFVKLGALDWDECFAWGSAILPKLPERIRPYERPKLVIPEGWKKRF